MENLKQQITKKWRNKWFFLNTHWIYKSILQLLGGKIFNHVHVWKGGRIKGNLKVVALMDWDGFPLLTVLLNERGEALLGWVGLGWRPCEWVCACHPVGVCWVHTIHYLLLCGSKHFFTTLFFFLSSTQECI